MPRFRQKGIFETHEELIACVMEMRADEHSEDDIIKLTGVTRSRARAVVTEALAEERAKKDLRLRKAYNKWRPVCS